MRYNLLWNLLLQMVKQGLVDHLYLTINQQAVGENLISISDLTDSFELISSEEIPPCQFNYYKKLTKWDHRDTSDCKGNPKVLNFM